MTSDDGTPLALAVVAAYLLLSGGYHLLDGLLKFGSAGDQTLNLLFATLSVVLGAGLLLSGAGLFRFGRGSWFLAAGLVALCTVMVDLMGALLLGTLAYGLDAVALLAGMALIVRAQSGPGSRADMDEEDSVHNLTDYP